MGNLNLSDTISYAVCNEVRYGPDCLAVCPPSSTFRDDQSVCQDCSPLCQDGCMGPLASQCNKCVHNAIKQGNVCVLTCDVGFFNNSKGMCVACSDVCLLTGSLGCSGPSSEVMLINYFVVLPTHPTHHHTPSQ